MNRKNLGKKSQLINVTGVALEFYQAEVDSHWLLISEWCLFQAHRVEDMRKYLHRESSFSISVSIGLGVEYCLKNYNWHRTKMKFSI